MSVMPCKCSGMWALKVPFVLCTGARNLYGAEGRLHMEPHARGWTSGVGQLLLLWGCQRGWWWVPVFVSMPNGDDPGTCIAFQAECPPQEAARRRWEALTTAKNVYQGDETAL